MNDNLDEFEKGRRVGLLQSLDWVMVQLQNDAIQYEEYVNTMKSEGTYVSDKDVIFYKRAAEEVFNWRRILADRLGMVIND